MARGAFYEVVTTPAPRPMFIADRTAALKRKSPRPLWSSGRGDRSYPGQDQRLPRLVPSPIFLASVRRCSA
ncbi:hypothetical protein EAH79_07040 [Sphingomonas koreensis]|nr:hypothetical protein EAH79_07040 [Sphingomonas koreensis]